MGFPLIHELLIWKPKNAGLLKKESGTLLITDSETYFDCETEYEHINISYKNVKDIENAIEKELGKRKNGVYLYLLAPENKKQNAKPEIGSVLKIKV